MKTIKAKDLLIKILNGEEVPEKIKCRGEIYTFVKDHHYKATSYRKGGEVGVGLRLDGLLDEEVEIIEEDKEIEKINSIKVPTISNSREKNIENIEETLNKYWFVINKLTEAVNELKKGK